jgi:signal transduction histidine kinase
MTGVTPTHPFASGRGLGSLPRASRLFLLWGALAVAVYPFLPGDARSIAYVAIGLAAVGAMYAGARLRPKPERLPWFLFAAGFFCEILGDAVFAVYEVGLDREPPLPSLADVFYLAGYPMIVLAIVLILRELGGHSSRAALLDTAIVAVALATMHWIFFVGVQVDEIVGSGARLVNAAYPSMDVLLLIALVELVLGPARRSSGYWLLLVAVALWVAADEIYLALGDNSPRAWLDCLWLGSYVVWGAAALDTATANASLRDRRQVPRLTTPRIVVLGAALLAVPVAALVESLRGGVVHVWVEAAGASVIAILVLVRLSGLVRAVEAARADERLARRAAEEMLAQLGAQNEQLLELDRLKDEFVWSASHDLRTPLTAITGYVDLLVEDGTDEQTHRYLEIVQRNVRRLRELVDDLLLAARLQVGAKLELERGRVDLAVLGRETLESAQLEADAAGVTLELVAPPELPLVDGDAERLERVLANLVANAIKFSPAGGRVELTLGAASDTVVVAGRGEGIGNPEEVRERLFDRFYRSQAALERRLPGTGLGLYIAREIVEAHDGSITVRSAVGEGTVVLVALPAAARVGATIDAEAAGLAASPPVQPGLR